MTVQSSDLDQFARHREWLAHVDLGDLDVAELHRCAYAQVDRLSGLLLDAVQTCTGIEDKLTRANEFVQQVAERVSTRLAQGETNRINSLGELQSTGREHDMACAELGVARTMLTKIAKVWKAAH